MVSAFQDRVLLAERCCALSVDVIKVQQLYFLFVSMKVGQRALLSLQHLKSCCFLSLAFCLLDKGAYVTVHAISYKIFKLSC